MDKNPLDAPVIAARISFMEFMIIFTVSVRIVKFL